ncbi:type II toxin-antitoxin system VapC family toxin [Candidatus Marsarchaeota archaeon]|nr:type II toxin-antitoxin system VapC family toxin [Candidatus Marsarchaeota archaeon]MCL5090144.1 type II toxin-antitoxin system VapC family toxin [Candidatus Marsarchaeota archaeon]
MASYCLDTDVIVNIIRGRQPLDFIVSVSALGVSTTIINLMELYYGAYKSGKTSDLALVDSLSKNLVIVQISDGDVRLAGKIMAELDNKGLRTDFRDVMVGAICINRDLILITRNMKHFNRMKIFGLSVSNA